MSIRPLHRGFKPSQVVQVPLTQVWTGRDEAPPLQVNAPQCLLYSLSLSPDVGGYYHFLFVFTHLFSGLLL